MWRWIVFAVLLAAPINVTAQVTFFQESFDGGAGTVQASDPSWGLSTASESPGSGATNMAHTGSSPGTLTLGPVDLTLATSATLTFLARRTSSYPVDSLLVFGLPNTLPAATSTWETVTVTIPPNLLGSSFSLVFEGRGGASSGSNIRIDDVTVSGDADLSGLSGTFGFQSEASSNATASITLPVDMLLSENDSLAGLQFDVSWDRDWASSPALSAPAFPPSGWTVSMHEATGLRTARVVVAATDTASPRALPPGIHTAVLSLSWTLSPPAAADSVQFTVSGLIASAAAADGHDILLPSGIRSHTLHFAPSSASFAWSAASPSFPDTRAGSTSSVDVYLRNPTGSSALVVDSMRVSDAAFTLGALPDPIASGDSAAVAVAFAPSALLFGQRNASVIVWHSAPSSPDTLSIQATGTGGRGDTDGDGAVDVADVIAGIDMVLGIQPPDLAPADVFPFPTGDGSIDVRDVTVAMQAILNNAWPDALLLPDPPTIAPRILEQPTAALSVSEPLRGFQVEWRDTPDGPLRRRIDARWPGDDIPPGSLALSVPSNGRLERLITVGISGQKTVWMGALATGTNAEPSPLPQDADLAIHPNPASTSRHGALTVHNVTGDELQLFDALGRRVRHLQTKNAPTSGASIQVRLDGLAPGLYVVQSGRQAKSVIITP